MWSATTGSVNLKIFEIWHEGKRMKKSKAIILK